MFSGRFGDTTGSPYLEALVNFPRLKKETGVSFLVDTGADETLLMPADARKAGIDYRRLGNETFVGGISGPLKCFAEKAFLVLSDNKRLIIYGINILIADKGVFGSGHCPSILGRDVLNRLRINYNPSKKRLIFVKVSADFVVPLKKHGAKRIMRRFQSRMKELKRLPD